MKFDMNNCPKVPLPELLSFVVDNRGKTVPTAENGHVLIATNCIKNENLYPAFEKIRYLSDETYRTWFRAHPQPGDVIFVNKGTPGRVCMVPDPVNFCIAQDMIAFRADKNKLYNKYLFAFLRSKEMQTQIHNYNVGDVIPHFKKSFLDKLLIPLPPMEIQRQIGDIYFDLSAKIDLNTKINHHLEQMAQAIFKSWFVDFEPFADSDFIDSELGEIPSGWSVHTIEYLADKVAMGPFGSNIKVETFVESGVPIISGNHLRGLYLDELGYNFITEEHAGRLSNSLVRAGDIIFTHAGNIGQVALIPDDCDYPYYVISQRQFYLRCDKTKALPEYINYFFHSREGQGKLLANASQTGVPSIARPSSHLKGIVAVLPPIEVQLKWFEAMQAMFQTLNSNNKESKRLAELRDSLLPRLMSGVL
ncbi:MAG: restriction endonuclease subunit S [Peptococcaceae bacterium]|nr:restriction endonuclease subunit S [Peptococcaceae bacterium]